MKSTYDLIFADPPYDLEGIEELPGLIFASNLLAEDGLLILEHSSGYRFEKHENFDSHRQYGSVNFSLFAKSRDRNPG